MDKYLRAVKEQWKALLTTMPVDEDVHIGLPNPYIAPTANDGVFARDQFYWDSYFIIEGLLAQEKVTLAQGMVENLVFLFERFRIVPSRNRFFNLGISQPPFLTSMILGVYESTADKEWLRRMISAAECELQEYWMDTQRAERHQVYQGLSRYCDHNVNHITAEHESGWDMTSRFDDRCLDFLPVDLNACLYKYETDLAQAYHLLGDARKRRRYLRCAAQRKRNMQMMWDGFFFDYDYRAGTLRKFYSLAGFYPLWAGLATQEQAAQCVKQLRRFEKAGGLVNTQARVKREYRQWDYPNGWPNQQFIVVQGLLRYGYVEDAQRIMHNWNRMVERVFDDTGCFWEKYDVTQCVKGRSGRYPTQSGFGWTDGVYVIFRKEMREKEVKKIFGRLSTSGSCSR